MGDFPDDRVVETRLDSEHDWTQVGSDPVLWDKIREHNPEKLALSPDGHCLLTP